MPYSVAQIEAACVQVVAANEFESCYIRPLLYVSKGGWSLSFEDPNLEWSLTITAWPWGKYLGEEALTKGIRANVSSFTRHHPNVSMISSKAAGHYVNSMLAKTESVRNGFTEAIMLDPQGYVAECTGANIFVAKDGVLYTPPSAPVLKGITRDTLMAIAEKEGIKVVEAQLARDQLYAADEVFVCGSAAEVVALREIDHREIGSGSMGPICAKLQKIYLDTVKGDGPAEFSKWLTPCIPPKKTSTSKRK